MAFDSLSEKLQNVFKNLRSKGKLTEDDVKAALKEVKMALLEADVNFKVVKQFTKSVQERAIGQDVMNGLNPGQMVIKIVNEEMIKLMGSETTEIAFRPGKELTVIMMVGLQGAGKTTTTAKIAGKLKSKGKKSLLVACDVYRPAAIEQLKINGEKQGVEVFSMGDKNKPADIAKAAVEHAKKNDFNVVIIDTAFLPFMIIAELSPATGFSLSAPPLPKPTYFALLFLLFFPSVTFEPVPFKVMSSATYVMPSKLTVAPFTFILLVHS